MALSALSALLQIVPRRVIITREEKNLKKNKLKKFIPFCFGCVFVCVECVTLFRPYTHMCSLYTYIPTTLYLPASQPFFFFFEKYDNKCYIALILFFSLFFLCNNNKRRCNHVTK